MADSVMVKHAKRELSLIGEDKETVAGYLKIVRAFESMGHSGTSAALVIPVISRLLSFENLSELTDDPEEWVLVDSNIWQSTRNPSAFSNNGGDTYHLVNTERPQMFDTIKVKPEE